MLLRGLFLGLPALATASTQVANLTADTFHGFMKANPLVLVESLRSTDSRIDVVPWCQYCQELEPQYEAAAAALQGAPVVLTRVNCDEDKDKEFCGEQEIGIYPTIRLFRGEDWQPYDGKRETPLITSYVMRQTRPVVSSIKSKEELEAFKNLDSVVVIAHLPADHPSLESGSNDTFPVIAKEFNEKYTFGLVTDESLSKLDGVTQPSVVLHKTYDEGINKLVGLDNIRGFIQDSARQALGVFGPGVFDDLEEAKLPVAYIFADTLEERTALADSLRPLGAKYKSQVAFVVADPTMYTRLPDSLFLAVKWPAFAIHGANRTDKYPFETQGDASALNEKAIDKFVADFLAGSLTPKITKPKPEDIPEEDRETAVAVVESETYDDLVLNNDKDVLVEYYAPWCGHCKRLAPVYDELSLLYKDHATKVTIAKVDATVHDTPEKITSYPTIKLFPAGNKSDPIAYKGSRSLEDMVKFIDEEGSHHVNGLPPAVEHSEL